MTRSGAHLLPADFISAPIQDIQQQLGKVAPGRQVGERHTAGRQVGRWASSTQQVRRHAGEQRTARQCAPGIDTRTAPSANQWCHTTHTVTATLYVPCMGFHIPQLLLATSVGF